ncbi:Asp23/Gls24 family envelope stress response protein [Streptomyces sp. NPDC015130]|uniref:Asp23/Gls24 family envelope stress response protein n=1 Tax=Streptomyces sp. NPDC015130 TaxID=3364940 RepID=UPI0036FAC419
MTERDMRAELEQAAGAAALATDGVAFLRPSLGGLLRRLAAGAVGRPAVGAADRLPSAREGRMGTPPAGVRVVRSNADQMWEVEIMLTVRRGDRALDVSRAVRRAVELAAEPIVDEDGASLGGRVRTTVVVTGIV